MTLLRVKYLCCVLFQLTSSQGGWLCSPCNWWYRSDISTHILTRRMTTVIFKIITEQRISTHILTRRMTNMKKHLHQNRIFQLTSSQGGWLALVLWLLLVELFQLTSSQGGWRLPYWKEAEHHNISTHILTRRMTLRGFLLWRYSGYFNSHPHKEDDLR